MILGEEENNDPIMVLVLVLKKTGARFFKVFFIRVLEKKNSDCDTLIKHLFIYCFVYYSFYLGCHFYWRIQSAI